MSLLRSLLRALGFDPSSSPPAAGSPTRSPPAASGERRAQPSASGERRAELRARGEQRDPAQLPLFEAALRDDDPGVREAAMDALYQLGKAARVALPAVLLACSDPAAAVRRRALTALAPGALGPPAEEVFGVLLARLGDDPDEGVRREALSILGSHLSALPPALHPRVLDAVLGAAQSPALPERRQAFFQLGWDVHVLLKLADERPRIVAALALALGDPDREVRWRAALALTRYAPLDRRPQPELLRGLLGPDLHLTYEAAQGLARRQDPALVAELVQASQEGSEQDRLRLAFALLLHPPVKAPVLQEFTDALRSGPRPRQLEAARLLAMGARREERTEPLQGALRGLLLRDDAELQAAALKALPFTGPGDAATVQTVLELLRSPDAPVRHRATEALGALARDAAVAVPAMRQALQDRDEDVRREAARVLGSLGERAAAAVPDLLALLAADPAQASSYVLYPLSSIGAPARPAAPLLVDLVLGPLAEYRRSEAAEALARVGAVEILPAAASRIEPALRQGSTRVRLALLEVAGGAGEGARSLVPAIADALAEPELSSRALHALRTLGPVAAGAASPVRAALRSLGDSDALTALLLLAAWGPGQPRDGEELRSLVLTRSPAFVRGALPALARLGAAAILPLLEATQSTDEALCLEAGRSLERLGPGHLDALDLALDHPDASLRLRALGALGELGPAAHPSLRRALTSTDERVREQAEIMLG